MELFEFICMSVIAISLFILFVVSWILFLFHSHKEHCLEVEKKVAEINRLRR